MQPEAGVLRRLVRAVRSLVAPAPALLRSEEKRALEARLRADGYSRTAAKHAVREYFSSIEEQR